MSDEIRFEAWTLPESGSFTRRTVISDVVDFQIQRRLSDVGSGSLTLPDTYPNKDLLLYIDKSNHANDVASLIRCFRGETLLAEWYAQLLSDTFSDEDPTFDLSGDSIESALDGMGVLPYDYPTQPTVDPDWIYGGASLLDNYDFEKAGTHHEQQSVYNNATGGTFRLTLDSINYTGNIAYNAAASVIETEVESLPGITTVNVLGSGVAANPWVIEFIDPTDPAATLIADDALLTGGTSTVALLTAGGTGLFGKWMRSTNPVSGLEHGVYTTFEVSTDQAHSGTHSLKIDGDAPTEYQQWPGAQQVITVTPGKTFRASVWVWTTSTTDPFVLIMRDSEENFIASSGEQTVTASTWTEITVAPFVIPSGVTSIIFRIAYVGGGNPAIFYVDDGTLAPGFPQASLGEIMGNLLDDLNTHLSVGSWLTRSFTDALDSDGVAWDQTLAWGIKRGQTLLQLLEYAARWGYEYQIRWTGSAHVLDLFNPNALGTDHSAAATPAIVGRITGSGPIVRRSPTSTWMLAEGDGGQYGTAEDTAMSGVFGKQMGYWGNKQGRDSTQLATAAARRLTEAAVKTEGLLVRVEDPAAGNLPLEDILIGDTVQVSLPGQITKAAYRVAAITVSNGTTPVYEYHLSSQVFDGDAAVVEGVNRLLRTFQGLEDNGGVAESPYEPTFLPTASGDHAGITLLVAASDAAQTTKDRADYICDGTNDEVEIQAALDEVKASGAVAGTVELSEGYFSVVIPAAGYAIDIPHYVSLIGQGLSATYVDDNSASDPGSSAALIHAGNYVTIAGIQAGCYWNNVPTILFGTNVYQSTVRDCWVATSSNAPAISCPSASTYMTVRNNHIVAGTGIETWGGVHFAGSTHQYAWVTDNTIVGGGTGILNAGGAFYGGIISRNVIDTPGWSGIKLAASGSSAPAWAKITDNLITATGSQATAVGTHGHIVLIGATGAIFRDTSPGSQIGSIIANNTMENAINGYGISVDESPGVKIVGNSIEQAEAHGIKVANSDGVQIVDNLIAWPGNLATAAGTYDGINVATTDYGLIVGNLIRPEQPPTSTYMRYGIRIETGCTANAIYGNDVRLLHASTVAYSDAGTGTLWGPAADEWNQGLTRTDGDVVYWDNTAGEYKLKTITEGGAGSDTTAIHDNVSGEIAAITEKVTPVSADLIVIEDSAAANVKKRVQIGNLPGGGSSPLTTKGDLYGYDTADARVPIGADDQLLYADSADAQGVVWKPVQIPSGTSFPVSPVDGQQFYRTDLDPSPALFTYDGARSKWLGELEWDGGGRNGSQATNTYLRRFNGMVMSASLGIWIPYPVTIVGMTMVWTTAATGLLQVRRNGTSVSALDFTGGAVTNATDMTLDDEFATGGIMAMYTATLSVSITSPQCKVWYRRHET